MAWSQDPASAFESVRRVWPKHGRGSSSRRQRGESEGTRELTFYSFSRQFEEWYTARKAEEEEEAKATLIASKAANPADAGSDPRPCLREPPRPVSSAEIASLAEDEQEKRGQMLINLGRKYEQV